MGWINRLFGVPEPEKRAMSWWVHDWESPFGPTAGQPVTRKSALGLSAAWSAIGLLSDSIATLPAVAFIEQGDERIPFKEPPPWLEKPNGRIGLTRVDVLNQVMTSLLLEGNAYIGTPRTNGEVEGLVVLDPVTVQLQQGAYRVNGKEVMLGRDITHIRGLTLPSEPPEDALGSGVIKVARESFSSALATQKFGESFFGNGAWMGAVVEVPGPLSEDGQKALKAYINERHRGAANAHKIGALVDGAKLSRPLTFSAEDSQFLETREFQVSDIARFFRVPAEMIGGKSTDALTYSTLEGRSTHFVKFSCLPWIVRIENALTNIWHSEGGPAEGVIKLKVDGLLRGSTKERYESYEIALAQGFMTINEVRALEDLEPLPEPLPKPEEEEDDSEDDED